jgi:diamine N-acetyltransferase
MEGTAKMPTPLSQQLEEANLADPLKASLARLFDSLAALEAEMPKLRTRRLNTLLGHLLKEVSNPETEVHSWELALDLARRWTSPYGERGQAVTDAAREVRNALRGQMGVYEPVTLVEITEENLRGILLLSETLDEPQRSMVADNAVSIAQAHFNKYAWFRGVYAGKAPVGFIMLDDNSEEPDYFLWRFMIASPYQGRGYGRQALDRLVDYVRTCPQATALGVSCGQGEGSPEEFYRKYGFTRTGEIIDEEIVLKIEL